MPANIALFTVALDNVGPARALLTLAERLDRTRFTPHVITALPSSRAVGREMERLDVPAATLGIQGPFDLRAFWRLSAQLRRWHIHLVHARLQRAGFYARVAAPVAGRPVVLVNVVNMYGNHFTSQHGPRAARPLVWAERRTAALVDIWVANSTAAAHDLESTIGVPAARVKVIANSVEPARFLQSKMARERVRREIGVGPEDLVVGTVARLVPLKRVDFLLDAMQCVRRESPAARLLVVGDGPMRSALQAHGRAVDAGAIFTGFRDDVPDMLAAMDIFAFASSSEGQPNVILEAMAAGLPVVAVQIQGIAELVIPGETGELTGENAEELAAGLMRLLSNPAAVVRMGASAKARAEVAFSPNRMVREFEAVYERALEGRSA